MIVAMAVVTTMVMPPTLRWALRRIPLTEEERTRIEREDADAKGFVPNLERVLVAVDSSANGRLASRVAGLLAGSRRILTTALFVSPDGVARAVAASARRASAEHDLGGRDQTKDPAVADQGAARSKQGRQCRGHSAGDSIKTIAATARTADSEDVEGRKIEVDVATLDAEKTPHHIIENAVKKGYGLLIIGLEPMVGADELLLKPSHTSPAASRGSR